MAPGRDAGAGDRPRGAGGGGGAARPDAAIDGSSIVATDAGLPPVCPAAATPPPPSVDSVGACGATLSLGGALQVAPAGAGQAYLRCGTVGSETTWQVRLSPDASRLAAVTSTGTIRLFATDDWREITQLASPIGQLDAAAFSPDGKMLAAVSRELGAVTLWQADSGQLIRSIAVPARSTIGGPSSALAFSSDGRLLVTSLEANVDLATNTVTDWSGKPIVPASPAPTDFDVASDDGNLVFAAQLRFVGCDRRVLLQASYPAGNAGFASGVSLLDLTGEPGLGGNLYAEIQAAASNDGRWVALIASDEGDPPPPPGLRLFDAASGALYASDGSATGKVVGFSPDGSELYLDLTSEIVVRAVPTLAILRRLPMAFSGALAAVSPLGPLIVSTPTMSFWLDPAKGTVLRQALFPISAPTFSADGRYGVASGGGALFHFWRETDATALCAPVAPPAGAAVATMALSPDGRTLGLERADGAVELRPVDQSGEVGALQATVATGFVPPHFATMRIANGGARMAVEGTPDPVASDPATSPSNVGVFDDTGQLLIAPAISSDGPPWLHLALSPDGGELAYVTGDLSGQQLAVASVDSNAVIFTTPLGPPLDGVDSFSADGTRLALPALDGMEIWRLADGQEESVVGNGGGPAWASAFSSGWTYLAEPTFPQNGAGVSYVSPYLSIWNPATATELARIDPLDLDSPARVDDSGTIVVADEMVTHTLATSWYALFVYDLPSATERRMFRTTSSEGEPVLTFAGGNRILTRLGSALALWCR